MLININVTTFSAYVLNFQGKLNINTTAVSYKCTAETNMPLNYICPLCVYVI